MKKVTLLLLALITIQYSKNDDSNNTQQVTISSCINPPTWLQGTWVNYSLSEPTLVESKLVITSNNITSYNYSESSTSWKDLVMWSKIVGDFLISITYIITSN